MKHFCTIVLAAGLAFLGCLMGVEAALGQAPEWAGIFGSRNLTVPNPNDPGNNYTMVHHAGNDQASHDALAYTTARRWGFEPLYDDSDNYGGYGPRNGAGQYGPMDESPNNRDQFADTLPDELYDSFIGGKGFLTPLSSGTPDTPAIGIPPEGTIFRIDVPNGAYRFVGVFGDAGNHHAHRVIAEDGGSGPPQSIGANHVVLVHNHDQAQFDIGQADGTNLGEGVFARVGFDDKLPPEPLGPGDLPVFVNMDEDGLATDEAPYSPTLDVTQGYLRIHLLQADSNDGPGGDGDANGGDIVLFEVYPIVLPAELVWDGQGSAEWAAFYPSNNSHWLEDDLATTVYPDDQPPGVKANVTIEANAQFDNMVTVAADRTAWEFTVSKPANTLAVGVAVNDNMTLTVDGQAGFDGGSQLTLGAGSALDVDRGLDFGDGATLSFGAGSSLSAGASLSIGAGSTVTLDNDVTLSAAGTAIIGSASPLSFGDGGTLSAGGTMTIPSDSPVSFGDNATLSAGSGSVASLALGGNATMGATAGTFSVASLTNTAPATMAKTGDGTLTLEDVTTVAGSSFRVEAGRLIIVHEGILDADLMLIGGEMILAGKNDRTDVAFHALTVEEDSILTAGPDTVGAAGPLTVTLGSQTEDVELNNGTLTVHTMDNYSLYVPGTISGPGNMDLVTGTITTDNPVSIGNLSVSGTLTAAGITAADVDINPGARVTSSGPITADNLNVSGGLDLTGSGPQGNVTINPGGTLSLIGSNLDLEGATLEASAATISIAWGKTLMYDKALTVATLDVAGTYTVMGTEPGSRDVTIAPGGQLKLGPGAILNMTGLTEGRLTTTGADVVVDGGDLKVANDFEANNVTVTDGGRMDTDGSHVTVNNSLNLGGNIFTLDQGDPFTAAGSDLLAAADITVHGGTLTVTPPTYFPAEGLLAYWTLDDPIDPGHDDSGNGHDLQLRNGTAHTTGGRYGGALVFDGNDDDATDPNGGDYLNGLSGLTVAMWIKADGAAVDRGFWEARDSGDADEWGGRYDSDGGEGDINVFKFGVTTTASGGNANRGADQYESAVNLQTTSWQHVACTWQDGTGFKLYVDGEPDVPTEPMSNTSGTTDMANRFTIGDGCKDYWDGMIDDVYIYGRALDEGEINAVYNHDFAFLPLDVPHVDLDVTATTTIAVEGEYDAVFGNLTLRPGADLTVTGPPAVSFNDVTTGPTATITLIDDLLPVPLKAGVFIRGVVSPGGNEPGLLTVDGIFELGDFAGYACTLADWNPDTNPDPWNENPPLVVNDKITITGNLEAYLAGTLTLRATSKLRVVGQFEQQWYGDQTRTIMDTVGESTISDWGAFLDVPAAGTHLGHGVFATDQGANGQPVTQTFTTVKVDVFQAADGDGNGDRYLNSDDILAILGANTFGTGLPADWGTGDYNADGICNSDDIQAILATNLWDPFSNLPYAAAVEPGDPGDGVVELMVNPADGMLVISADDVTINSYVIKSSAGIFTGEAADNLGFFVEDTDTRVSGSFAFTLLGQHELGRVIGSEWEILAKDDVDLTFTYTVRGAGGTFEGNLIIIPEPGTVVMLLTGAVALLLLAVRRRRAG